MSDLHRAVRARLVAVVSAALLALPLVGLPVSSADAATTVTFTQRASGLRQPTQVTSAHDGTGRLFITEKTGRVRIFVGGKLLARPFLDIRSRVRTAGEGGLLSIAFHPRYRSHPFVWVAYTDKAGDLRVARFRARSPRANRVRAGSYHRVIDVPHPARFDNHFAGQLVFGRGSLLYLSTGDGGSAGDPNNHAQDKSSLQGKLLRLKVIGAGKACGRAYCVPASNPYAGRTPGRGEIWAVGLRNAWRFSVDAVTGDLWVGDVGQDLYEEIDRLPAGVGGLNLGWSCHEATSTYDASRCRSGTSYLEPEWSYGHDYGEAVTGGFVYRGARFANRLGGTYLGGDFISGRVFTGTMTGITTVGRLDGVTSFGEDADLELWAVTIGGGLYQLSAA
jgi:glucose/arabinose dehydrogenase